jgi:hypothetical protein
MAMPLAALTAGVLLTGCGAVIPRVTPELVTLAHQHDPAVSDVDLERTRTLFINRCGSCHAVNDPRDYTPAEWADWLRKMGRKAKLRGHQEADLLVFVLAARDLPPEP